MSFPPSDQLLTCLVPWFEVHGRHLPWRAENLDVLHPDPYAVLVSEIMLQQTQVSTVILFFTRWMERFPDVKALAHASDDVIHRYWQGLGYYRRATHLRAAAAYIAQDGWPKDLNGLMALPGLGPYTAAALASIAFQQPEPALDGNAFRVLARLLGLRSDPQREAASLREWLRPSLEVHGPSRITQAIMELGALVCLPVPRCVLCPLSVSCEAHRLGMTREIPPRVPRVPPKQVELCLVALEAEGHFLVAAPEKRGLLAGLWRWPSLERQPEYLAAESRIPYSGLKGFTWPGWTQIYTHRREQVTPVRIQLAKRVEAPKGMRWVSMEELSRVPMGKRDQRFRDLLKSSPMQTDKLSLQAIIQGILKS